MIDEALKIIRSRSDELHLDYQNKIFAQLHDISDSYIRHDITDANEELKDLSKIFVPKDFKWDQNMFLNDMSASNFATIRSHQFFKYRSVVLLTGNTSLEILCDLYDIHLIRRDLIGYTHTDCIYQIMYSVTNLRYLPLTSNGFLKEPLVLNHKVSDDYSMVYLFNNSKECRDITTIELKID